MAYFLISGDSEQAVHSRSAYTFIDVLGDYGGLLEGLSICIIFVLTPLAEHEFIRKALSKMFLARTNDAFLFNRAQGKRQAKRKRALTEAKRSKDEQALDSLKKSRIIKISFG